MKQSPKSSKKRADRAPSKKAKNAKAKARTPAIIASPGADQSASTSTAVGVVPAAARSKPGPKPGEGAEPELTEADIADIVKMMATGMPDTHCGPLLNPPRSRQIVSHWKALAGKPNARPIYLNLLNAVRAAKARRLQRNLALVMVAGTTDWRAALAMSKIDARELFAETVVNYTSDQWNSFNRDQLAKVASGRDPYE